MLGKFFAMGVLGLADLALVMQHATSRLPAALRLLLVPVVLVPVTAWVALLGVVNLAMMARTWWDLGKASIALAATPDPGFIGGIIERLRLTTQVVSRAMDKRQPEAERDAARAELSGCAMHLVQWIASRGDEADGPGFEA
jgi:hypothetical protein